MDHREAVQQMAAERYLLNELTPEARDAFEEHLFDCPECALDLRAGAAFVDEARTQLPELTENLPSRASAKAPRPEPKRSNWLSWWRPAFAAPVFAAMLLVIGYQNLAVIPALRAVAQAPRLVPMTALHANTRAGEPVQVVADRKSGLALPISVRQGEDSPAYAGYAIDWIDAQGRVVWTGTLAAAGQAGDQKVMLAIPGALLRDGSYAVVVYGVGPAGERAQTSRYAFDLHLTN